MRKTAIGNTFYRFVTFSTNILFSLGELFFTLFFIRNIFYFSKQTFEQKTLKVLPILCNLLIFIPLYWQYFFSNFYHKMHNLLKLTPLYWQKLWQYFGKIGTTFYHKLKFVNLHHYFILSLTFIYTTKYKKSLKIFTKTYYNIIIISNY